MDLSPLFNGVSIAGVFLGVAFILLFFRHHFQFKGKWIVSWMLVVALHQIYFLLTLNQLIAPTSNLHFFGFPLTMLHLPLFYLNIVSLQHSVSRPVLFLHLSPYFLYALTLLLYAGTMTETTHSSFGYLLYPESASSLFRNFNPVYAIEFRCERLKCKEIKDLDEEA